MWSRGSDSTCCSGTWVGPAGATPVGAAQLAARLRAESGPPVELLFVADADPLHSLPGSWGIEQALAGVGTIVVLSSFRDDTTLHADLVLPLNTELERFNAVTPAASVGLRVLGLARPVVDALGSGNHPADVLLALATALGNPVAGRFAWSSLENLVRERIEEDLDGLPGGAGADAYPFLLLPFASLKIGDGRGANRPWLQELPDPMSTVMWDSWAELSPTGAERLGVRDGDRLRITSAAGAVEAQAVLDPTVRPGLIGIPRGQGHSEYGRYAQGRGTNPLDLVGRGFVDDTSAHGDRHRPLHGLWRVRRRVCRKPFATAVVGFGVLIGMWIERFLIVVGTLRLPRMEFNVGTYSPSWVELGVLVGSFGMFAMLYFLFVQFAPIVSLWEVREGDHIAGAAAAGPEPATEEAVR